ARAGLGNSDSSAGCLENRRRRRTTSRPVPCGRWAFPPNPACRKSCAARQGCPPLRDRRAAAPAPGTRPEHSDARADAARAEQTHDFYRQREPLASHTSIRNEPEKLSCLSRKGLTSNFFFFFTNGEAYARPRA